ncbi:lipopolysaccharide biosynthesis protein [Virgibacillus sp. CBA3643]|uniref:lipopolysaccharide biosynthesis protein n=1 Tax=Virgibacillus sp. CBA3643 TaxID=2942278 RepID=UPI0035A293D2
MKKYLWFLVGNLSYAIMQWLILIIIIKFSGSYDAGLYSLGLAISSPILIFFNLQLRNQQAVEMRGKYSFADFFYVRLFTSVIAIIFIISIIFIIYGTNFILIFVGILKFVDSFFDLIYGRYHQLNRTDIIGKIQFLRTSTTLPLLFITFLITDSLLISLLTLNLLWFVIIFSLYCYGSYVKTLNMSFNDINKSKIKTLVRDSLPLGASGTMVSLMPNIPKYLIQYYIGTNALGIYTAIITLISSVRLFINSVTQFFLNRMSKYLLSNDSNKYNQIMKKQLLISLGIILLLVAIFIPFGELILTTVYTPEYKNYLDLFYLFLGAHILLVISSILLNGLFAQKQYKIQLYINALSIILQVILGIIFITHMGIEGIALAMGVTYCTQLIITSLIYIKRTRSYFDARKL